jgi:hypothetical protein
MSTFNQKLMRTFSVIFDSYLHNSLLILKLPNFDFEISIHSLCYSTNWNILYLEWCFKKSRVICYHYCHYLVVVFTKYHHKSVGWNHMVCATYGSVQDLAFLQGSWLRVSKVLARGSSTVVEYLTHDPEI